VPPPDAVPSLKSAGFQIVANSYPHSWPWTFNLAREDSPFRDIRVRHAINYCVNRDGLVTLLNGLAEPAFGLFKKADPFFGKPKQQYAYDPAKAKALLKEAGYGPEKPVKAKIMITTSGSGALAWITLPACTSSAPVLPSIGAVMRVNFTFRFALSS